ncbi:hypothetical protein GQ44DRAFT_772419 [Phaeosphaeriaceae sp. PMI808]|nr:hypothetical protein GQ44DRAFT_772419 [Phaeosphaeriaceae sp. PMI808]
MSTHSTTRPHQLYPSYYFRASPTYDIWVKLTAADVQALRTESEFQGQNLYFHLNHPIRFVRLVGVVVAIDDINLRYTVLTVDDGSGANIELKIVRLPSIEKSPLNTSSATAMGNVTVTSRIGVFQVMVDDLAVDIGTVVKAKGTISEFRGIKQLDLKRIWVVTTTNEEAQAWAETAAFKHRVLSSPWHLSSSERKQIKSNIKSEKKKAREYERRKAEYDAKKGEQTRTREERLELRRQKEETIMNTGALV